MSIESLFPENYSSLHVHWTSSFLDGANRPSDGAKRAKELGMTAIAMTDHNTLAGAFDFNKACKENEIKPIFGLESYWTWDTNVLSLSADERTEMAMRAAEADGLSFELPAEMGRNGKLKKPKKMSKKEITQMIKPYHYDTTQYHILLIAMNQNGWRNLVKLQSEASEKCTFNGRFICDDELLAKYSDDLICSTACIGSAPAELINAGRIEEAEAIVDRWHSIFGDRFYLEIQPLNIELQWRVNMCYTSWAKQKGIKLLATNDVHYTLKEDWDDHDTLLCVQTGKFKNDENRMKYSNDFWIKSIDEMIITFEEQAHMMEVTFDFFDFDNYMEAVGDALRNTNLIADMIQEIKLGADKPLLPEVDVPYGFTAEQWLTLQVWRNLYKYKNFCPEIDMWEYSMRLNEELDVINSKGFAPYMLIVQDYVQWANDHGCPTGPGRGSAAGSLVLFLLGITKMIDPIKYQLLFFRFLTKDRTALPDVDIDFEYDRRPSVIEHMEDRYGKPQVAHIGNFSELGVKSGLKDFGRTLQIDFGIMNNITKKMDEILEKPEVTFKDYDDMKNSEDASDRKKWEEFDAIEKANPELFRLARKFEGIPRQLGVHASGVLITPMPITDLIPTRKAKDGSIVTLYSGTQLEELNFCKFDILGLKTISVIKQTLNFVDPNMTMEDLYDKVNVDDPEIFDMICDRQVDGLFQIESDLFKGVIDGMQPNSLNDIIALTALCRPGPLGAGMHTSYNKRKHGKEEAVEPLKGTWDIVKNTYGTICYQEQCMLIAQVVAGYNGNQSDSILRKAIAKKKKDKMELARQLFIFGKVNEEPPRGYDPKNKDQVLYDPKAKYGDPIDGGIKRGYNQKTLEDFWVGMEGYASYLFNLSHAACYSYITVLTAYLKKYHPVEFMAALLTYQEKEEKIDRYCKVSESMGIKVKTPDVNKSGKSFTPDGKAILYGLGSIKGVGASSLPDVIANQPYASLEEAIEKATKKSFNKTVGEALIKAGAWDFLNPNRNALLNSFHDIRGDKLEALDEDDYDEALTMAYEQEVLGTPITFKPWWDKVSNGEKVCETMELLNVQETVDKKGRLMAFATGKINGCQVRGVIFGTRYMKLVQYFDMTRNTTITIEGHKDDKGSLVINKAARFNGALLKDKAPIAEKLLA